MEDLPSSCSLSSLNNIKMAAGLPSKHFLGLPLSGVVVVAGSVWCHRVCRKYMRRLTFSWAHLHNETTGDKTRGKNDEHLVKVPRQFAPKFNKGRRGEKRTRS
jgi:hypothetical protein